MHVTLRFRAWLKGDTGLRTRSQMKALQHLI